jgi:DNA-binding transcriptional LysR family regulator
MNTEQLKTFLLTADNGSFSKAEQSSHLSKQAMMKQVDSIEKEVGVPLFLRCHTGLKLTEAGKIFYEGARELLQKEEKLMADCRSTSGQSSIRIGALQHQVILDPINEIFSRGHINKLVNSMVAVLVRVQ